MLQGFANLQHRWAVLYSPATVPQRSDPSCDGEWGSAWAKIWRMVVVFELSVSVIILPQPGSYGLEAGSQFAPSQRTCLLSWGWVLGD